MFLCELRALWNISQSYHLSLEENRMGNFRMIYSLEEQKIEIKTKIHKITKPE